MDDPLSTGLDIVLDRCHVAVVGGGIVGNRGGLTPGTPIQSLKVVVDGLLRAWPALDHIHVEDLVVPDPDHG
jgi:hypothetical protein